MRFLYTRYLNNVHKDYYLQNSLLENVYVDRHTATPTIVLNENKSHSTHAKCYLCLSLRCFMSIFVCLYVLRCNRKFDVSWRSGVFFSRCKIRSLAVTLKGKFDSNNWFLEQVWPNGYAVRFAREWSRVRSAPAIHRMGKYLKNMRQFSVSLNKIINFSLFFALKNC